MNCKGFSIYHVPKFSIITIYYEKKLMPISIYWIWGMKMRFIFKKLVWVNTYVHISIADDNKRPQVYQGMCLCKWVFDCGHLG